MSDGSDRPALVVNYPDAARRWLAFNALYTKLALLFPSLALLQLLVVTAMDFTSSLGWLETYPRRWSGHFQSSNFLLLSRAAAALLLAILFVKWADAARQVRVLA